MVTNDWQQIISGDLGRTLFSQERSHVQAFQREWYMAANLERIHDFMPETFQVNAQNLHKNIQELFMLLLSKLNFLIKKTRKRSGDKRVPLEVEALCSI